MNNISLTISVPEHVKTDKRSKDITIQFDSVEEKRQYVIDERSATAKALEALGRAWTEEERTNGYVGVYEARKNFFNAWKAKKSEQNHDNDQLA